MITGLLVKNDSIKSRYHENMTAFFKDTILS